MTPNDDGVEIRDLPDCVQTLHGLQSSFNDIQVCDSMTPPISEELGGTGFLILGRS